MKIIIIGCGNVGYTLARILTAEKHNVVVIDDSQARLSKLDEVDAMPICGNGASVAVQSEAGVETADLLIAVTNSDEVNLLCCLIAGKTGHCHTIARVRDPIYNNEIGFIKEKLGISMIINPEMSSAHEISRILRFPLADSIESFEGGRVELIKFKLTPDLHLNGYTVREIDEKFKAGVLITGVVRDREVTIPGGSFVLMDGDMVTILATPKNSQTFFKKIGVNTHQVKNAMLLGGGRISEYLSEMLIDMKISVKIIEKSRERCDELSEAVDNALVINGNATDRQLLIAEGLGTAESVVSLLGVDEENMIMSLYVQENSKAKMITRIKQLELGEMLNKLELGSVVYPKQITADRILQFVRSTSAGIGSEVERLYHIMDNKAEALEFKVKDNSEVTKTPLMKLNLKKDLLIGCIIRDGRVFIPRGQDTIQVGDFVIVVTTNQGLKALKDIVK